ncbi:GFA family protein [Altererythrobacter sp. MF3-039]|uniref:GFA family protein n=1 Tax=Altererythrobacter sp. MF3-039 TaxID=3252901 RepID=UPI00390C94D2
MGQTGKCLCGAVNYEAQAEPLMQAVCHCKNCQRQAGSAMSIIVGYPKGTVDISGEVTTYDDSGESGLAVHRQFCPKCGSPLFTLAESAPDMIFIKAGSFDDTSWLQPSIHFWTQSAQSWFEMGDVPQTPGNPGA